MTKRGDITKNKILKSALNLFVEQGIDRTTTVEITKKAGIAEGTLFLHFETKQKLIDALYVKIKKGEMQYFSSSMHEGADAKECTMSFLRVICEYFMEREEEYRFIELVCRVDYVSKEAVQKGMAGLGIVEEKMELLHKQGLIKNFDSMFMKMVIWNMCKGIIEYGFMHKRKSIPKGAIDMIWDAMKK